MNYDFIIWWRVTGTPTSASFSYQASAPKEKNVILYIRLAKGDLAKILHNKSKKKKMQWNHK